MPAFILATIAALAAAVHAAPAHAQVQFPFQLFRSNALPDAVEFGSRIENNDLEAAKDWLDRGLDPDFVGDRIGTGLMIAAWQGSVPMMELFAAKGADINRMNALGEQALMHAAWRGNLEAVQWLMGKGATLNRSNKQWTALHYASFSGKDEVVKFLVARGADIDARSPNGSTPLMMAVYEGRESTVKQLVRLGADRKLTNDTGEGAMDWAFKHEQVAIARSLGSMQEFAAAANRPKAEWKPAVRSQPVTAAPPVAQAAAPAPAPAPAPGAALREQIAELTRIRATLASRDMQKEVQKLDTRIATLRYRLAKAEDSRRPATLEITASRKAPTEQRARYQKSRDGESK